MGWHHFDPMQYNRQAAAPVGTIPPRNGPTPGAILAPEVEPLLWLLCGVKILTPPGVELDMKEWLPFWSQNYSSLVVCVGSDLGDIHSQK